LADQREFHRKSLSEKVEDRSEAIYSICFDFSDLPDKNQAWEDLHRLSTDEDSEVRGWAAYALGWAFSEVPDKNQAWEDLHRLSTDEDSEVRGWAAQALGWAFSEVPNKKQAWDDLHRLSTDEDSDVRGWAAFSIGLAFSEVPDKKQAWKDLHRLSIDENDFVREWAAFALSEAFSEVPDKSQAWKDLHRLSTDEDSEVRGWAASTLDKAFFQVPDKNQVWDDLHRLSTDEDGYVRGGAALSIGWAFSEVPNKKQAWEDLHRLSTDDIGDVRERAASALCEAFSQLPDKKQALEDLHRLSTDDDRSVRVSANHSLGRASISKATEAEDEEDLRMKLEDALEFFERSAEEATDTSPSKFCLPFYRSFYALTFKKQDAEADVQKYLEEAKSASEGSQSKEKLLEAIENLSNALKEARNLGEMNLDVKKHHLNACRRYCDRAAELLADTREDAPGATKLIEKGIPIIDHRIRETLAEIREKTRAVCKQTLDTPAEEFGKEIARQGKALCQVRDPIQLNKALFNLDRTLSSQLKDPEIQELIEQARTEPNVEDKLNIYNIILGLILGKSQRTKEGLAETVNIQNFNVSSDKDEKPWYRDRNALIAIAGVLVAALGVLVSEIL